MKQGLHSTNLWKWYGIILLAISAGKYLRMYVFDELKNIICLTVYMVATGLKNREKQLHSERNKTCI